MTTQQFTIGENEQFDYSPLVGPLYFDTDDVPGDDTEYNATLTVDYSNSNLTDLEYELSENILYIYDVKDTIDTPVLYINIDWSYTGVYNDSGVGVHVWTVVPGDDPPPASGSGGSGGSGEAGGPGGANFTSDWSDATGYGGESPHFEKSDIELHPNKQVFYEAVQNAASPVLDGASAELANQFHVSKQYNAFKNSADAGEIVSKTWSDVFNILGDQVNEGHPKFGEIDTLQSSFKNSVKKFLSGIVGDFVTDAIMGAPISVETVHSFKFVVHDFRYKVKGGDKEDAIWGGFGNNKIASGKGNDFIAGSDGNDKIKAGSGSDMISGGADRDKLWGQKGRDEFYFSKGYGKDTIKDLDLKKDDIILNSNFGLGAKQFKKAIEEYSKGVKINLGEGDVLKIEGVKKSSIHKVDFDILDF